ncbi:hypothetical protein PS1_023486 [Malus domestica]
MVVGMRRMVRSWLEPRGREKEIVMVLCRFFGCLISQRRRELGAAKRISSSSLGTSTAIRRWKDWGAAEDWRGCGADDDDG